MNTYKTYENALYNPTGLLLRLLASIIYHSDWITQVANKNSQHPFLCIPLLNNPELLLCLKAKVTIEMTEGMPQATVIPPHVEQMKMQRQLLTLCQQTLDKVDGLMNNFVQQMNNVFEERALESGQITATQIKTMLHDLKPTICKDVQETIHIMQMNASAST